MNKWAFVFLTIVSYHFLSAQKNFEGVFTIDYINEKKELSKLSVKVKDQLILLKSTQGGIAKYSHYILNLDTREFFAISTPEKKVVIKYDIDTLLHLYERTQLKDGYKINSTLTFKSTDKTKEENGLKLTKLVGENDIYKSYVWTTNESYNFNNLIPVLRLLNCWNEAQPGDGITISAEVSNKVSKRESSVAVTLKKQPVSKEIFELPQNYLLKDFSKHLSNETNLEKVKMILQTFAEF